MLNQFFQFPKNMSFEGSVNYRKPTIECSPDHMIFLLNVDFARMQAATATQLSYYTQNAFGSRFAYVHVLNIHKFPCKFPLDTIITFGH